MKGVKRQITFEIVKTYTIICHICGSGADTSKKNLKEALSHFRTLGWFVADKTDEHKCVTCVKTKRGKGDLRTLHNMGIESPASQVQGFPAIPQAQGFPPMQTQESDEVQTMSFEPVAQQALPMQAPQGFPTTPPKVQGFPMQGGTIRE